MDESIIKQEANDRKRPTAAILKQDLEKGNYGSLEEKHLIETTLEYNNSNGSFPLSAIMKDEDLRKVWTIYFYKKRINNKNDINKLNLPEIIKKIEAIQGRLPMQHMASLLAGLGEILMKKYNFTEGEVRNLLQVIIDPAEKQEEAKNTNSPKRKDKSQIKQPRVVRPVSTYKLLDLSMLLIPQDYTGTSYADKSSESSRLFGHAMSGSGDDQIIHRDDQILSDMERSYHQLGDMNSGNGQILGDPKSGSDLSGIGLRNMEGDPTGSIARKMLLKENSSSNEFGMLQGMDQLDEQMDGFDHDMMDQYIDSRIKQHPINIQNVDMETPDIDLEVYNNIVRSESDDSQRQHPALVRKPRRLQDLLKVDKAEEMTIQRSLPPSTASSKEHEVNDTNIDADLKRNFKRVIAQKAAKNKSDDNIAYDSAFYSTDDESGNELNFVENIVRECKNLPLKVKKQLQVIKEEAEEQMDFGFDDQMDMMDNDNK